MCWTFIGDEESVRTRRCVQWCARLSLPAVLLAAVPAFGGDECCSTFPCGPNGNKVLVCHVPPDDPSNAHTICISPSACPAHLANHPGDQCGPCAGAVGAIIYAGDVGGDGLVGIGDLLEVIGSWGACPKQPEACPADLDVDGSVGVADLLIVLTNWD